MVCVYKLGYLPGTWPQGLSVQGAVLGRAEPSAAQVPGCCGEDTYSALGFLLPCVPVTTVLVDDARVGLNCLLLGARCTGTPAEAKGTSPFIREM